MDKRTTLLMILALAGFAAAAQEARQPYTAAPVRSNVSVGQGNPFLGSMPAGTITTEPLHLSFGDAIDRGLKQNLGLLLAGDSTTSARATRWRSLSDLLPNVNAHLFAGEQTQSLDAFGFHVPGVPTIIGPFHYVDARGTLSQSVFNFRFIQNLRASNANLEAARYSYQDARDLVVLAVGNAYLQVIAAAAREQSAEAQVTTAQALQTRALAQLQAGTTPQIDELRARVELQTRQQQLIVARNNVQQAKLSLGRAIGLPPGQKFEITDKAPYQNLPAVELNERLQRAYQSRSDYKALSAQVKSAELALSGARAGYYPNVTADASYGDIGTTLGSAQPTYAYSASLNVPIFQGGKTHSEVLQAEANLHEAQSRTADLRSKIEYEVRTALMDLDAAGQQVEVARSSVDLAAQALTQAQDRFAAGVSDNLEVVQAQQAVALANEQYIASLYAHNLAKVELARAEGVAEQGVKAYLSQQH